MQVKIANWRAGGSARFALSPKSFAYKALAASTALRTDIYFSSSMCCPWREVTQEKGLLKIKIKCSHDGDFEGRVFAFEFQWLVQVSCNNKGPGFLQGLCESIQR
jgi:hypothetical protein